MQQSVSSSAEIVRIPVSPEARLLAALRMLETRLTEQRAAIEAWRGEMAKLAGLVGSIDAGARGVQQDLGLMGARLGASRAACLRAESRAGALVDCLTAQDRAGPSDARAGSECSGAVAG